MLSWRDSYRARLAHTGPVRANQLAPALSDTVFYCYGIAFYGQGGVGNDNLVDPMSTPAPTYCGLAALGGYCLDVPALASSL